MKLAALQTAFQEAILDETDEILAAIMPSRELDSAARFAIYADAYRSRLAEFLANDYPVLHLVLGDEGFGMLAAAYIDSTPSVHRNARWYAHALPDFMRAHAPWCDTRIFIDLARFERALSDAFDAADTPGLDAAALGSIAPDEQPRLSFTFAPSVALLTLRQGTTACYETAIENQAASLPETAEEETILIWRSAEQEPFYRALEEDEALAFAAATSGASLEEICGLLSLRNEAETAASHAAGFLLHWFADGLVTGLACR
jgi:hypothetical protein